jgi:3-phosphoshikimate 1-carboxyvinyltransferase
MKLITKKTESITGEAYIPSSKSHSIRAIFFASLASGTSKIKNVLDSEDVKAAINACTSLGAKIKQSYEIITIGPDD